MASPISIYLQDDTLRKLDALVEKQARIDRAAGLEGRAITNRSKMIERIINQYCEEESALSIETIRYWVINLAEEYGAKKVSLFGSYARGDNHADSDVDILLDKGEIRGMKVLEFQEELSEKLGRPVDVVTTAGASERFLRKINEDAVTLYEVA